MLHLDPSTPLGLLDTVGHVAPLLLSAGGSALTLSLGRLLDRKGK